jgi:cyclohexanone monooxygenase
MRQAARETPVGVVVPTYPDRSVFDVSEEERNEVFESAWGQYIALLSTFNDIATNPEANEIVAEFVRNKIRSIVKDPEVAELLAPKDYPIGTKRICIDSGYFETYNRDNIKLVSVKDAPIVEITPKGLRTTEAEYEFDVIVFATGFDAMTGTLFGMNITGKDNTRLDKKWEAGPRAYLGIVSAGFPNLFMITGPGSPSVLSNMTTSIEQHVDFAVAAIKYLRDNNLDSMDASVEAEDAWLDHVAEVASHTLYPRANSWYMGANIPGKPRVFMPYIGGVGNYRIKCDEVVANNYEGFVLTS